MRKSFQFLATICLVATTVSGCAGLGALKDVGREPPLTPISDPTAARGYHPIALPMPTPEQEVYQANSLWQTGAKGFFRDQRARRVGDILTVQIDISDQASLDNTTDRSRSSSEDGALTNLLGLETYLTDILPEAATASSLVDTSSTSASNGSGSIDRAETIDLTVAALVTQILPNGNMVIQGRQEVRVNYEVRELLITGVVRPEDISNTNTIQHTQIAEARVSYGGRGQISKLQQPRYGQQIYEIFYPF